MSEARVPGEDRARRESQERIDGPFHYWVDGAVVRSDDTSLDRAMLEVGLCYTTTRIDDGEPLWPSRHAARLARDAEHHGLEAPHAGTVIAAMLALGRAEFGAGEGIVRLQLGLDAAGRTRLVGIPRSIGHEPDAWRLGASPIVHPGPEKRGGAKLLGQAFIEDTRRWLEASGFDEAIMLDAAGLLVEGSRSNLIVVDAAGRPCFADRALGGVSGVGLEVSCECVPDLAPARLGRDDLCRAREIVAVNAVRGARPCTSLDGEPVGDGTPGPFAAALAAALDGA